MSARIAFAFLAVVGLCTCTKSEPAKPAAATATSAPSSSASKVVIAATGGGEALQVEIDGTKIDVHAGARHVVGQTKGDKRYYHQGSIDGAAFVEVKISDAGFKLRTPDSQLLWKIKIADDKIKVSDNEENANAWTLKTKYDDKVKIEDPAEHEIGEVRFNADTGKIKVKDASDKELFVVDSGKRSAAYGVLLMRGIPEQYRDVILAELIARGQ